jgi:hypothetical protein
MNQACAGLGSSEAHGSADGALAGRWWLSRFKQPQSTGTVKEMCRSSARCRQPAKVEL